jgi:hypothetical protein
MEERTFNMAIINMPALGERRKDLPRITISPRLRLELSAKLLELANALAGTACPRERAPIEVKFAAIADPLSVSRA